MYIKGKCQNCGGHVEFDQGAIGQVVACPHCRAQTVLRLPTYFKGECQKCGGRIEFDEAGVGQVVTCPHCQERTTLRALTCQTPPRETEQHLSASLQGSHPEEFSQDLDYSYWAFISYSSRDVTWARWLHRAIETYGIPAQLVSHPTPAGHPAPSASTRCFATETSYPLRPIWAHR